MRQQIIALDFDGTINSYKSGWTGPRNIPDPPVEGAIRWIENFMGEFCDYPEEWCAMAPRGKYKLVIFSSRSRYWGGKKAIKRWLIKHGMQPLLVKLIGFPLFKPPSKVLIDDRVIPFNGTFPSFSDVDNFIPWNKK